MSSEWQQSHCYQGIVVGVSSKSKVTAILRVDGGSSKGNVAAIIGVTAILEVIGEQSHR